MAVLKAEILEDWIDEGTPREMLKDILKNKVQRGFATRPVSQAVNQAENNSPGPIQRV